MEGQNCVVCYDKKAKYFCSTCKQSSGLCGSCWIEIQAQIGRGCDYDTCPCVICKKEMERAMFIRSFSVDLETMGELCWKENLAEEKRMALLDVIWNVYKQ